MSDNTKAAAAAAAGFAWISALGCRWALLAAVAADDPDALTFALKSCAGIEYDKLASEECGKYLNAQVSSAEEYGGSTRVELLRSDEDFRELVLVQHIRRIQMPNLETLVFGIACKYGRANIVNHLLSDVFYCPLSETYHGTVDPAFDDQYSVYWASREGHVDTVKILLRDTRVDPSAENNHALCHASKYGHLHVVQLLLAHRNVDPSVPNSLALRLASFHGHIEVVRLLLSDCRVDPSRQENEAIRHACRNGHIEVVQLLLSDCRVDPPRRENEALRHACRNGHIEVVKALLSYTYPHSSTSSSFVVRWASRLGYNNIAKVLDNGRQVNPAAQDNFAFHNAAANGHTEIVKLLLTDSRVDPFALDNIALRKALQFDRGPVVKLLLERIEVTHAFLSRFCMTNGAHPTSAAMYELILLSQPQFWPRIIDNYDSAYIAKGNLAEALTRIEARSAFLLLLCVKRYCSPSVAGRVADVLREVCSEWLRFKYDFFGGGERG
jgi:ankyrin repeat protein